MKPKLVAVLLIFFLSSVFHVAKADNERNIGNEVGESLKTLKDIYGNDGLLDDINKSDVQEKEPTTGEPKDSEPSNTRENMDWENRHPKGPF